MSGPTRTDAQASGATPAAEPATATEIGEASKIAVVAISAFFPVIVNTYTGVVTEARGTSPGLLTQSGCSIECE